MGQGYPAELVSHEFSKAAEIPRNDLLKPRVQDPKKKIFPFILTFNMNLPSINGLIRKHFHFYFWKRFQNSKNFSCQIQISLSFIHPRI